MHGRGEDDAPVNLADVAADDAMCDRLAAGDTPADPFGSMLAGWRDQSREALSMGARQQRLTTAQRFALAQCADPKVGTGGYPWPSNSLLVRLEQADCIVMEWLDTTQLGRFPVGVTVTETGRSLLTG